MLTKLLEILEAQVEPWIHPLRSNADFWYFVSLSLATLIVITIRYREKIVTFLRRESYSAHDKALFLSLRATMNELDVRDFIKETKIEYMHSPHLRDSINRLSRQGRETESRYLNPQIQYSFTKFLDSYDQLESFVRLNFYFWSEDWYRMEPELQKRLEFGNKEDEAKWAILIETLTERSDTTLNAFEEYRLQVKKLLLV